MQRSYPITGFREASVQRVFQFTIMRLQAIRPVNVTQSEVARSLRATRLGQDELLFQSA
jgi:hypothetical protein